MCCIFLFLAFALVALARGYFIYGWYGACLFRIVQIHSHSAPFYLDSFRVLFFLSSVLFWLGTISLFRTFQRVFMDTKQTWSLFFCFSFSLTLSLARALTLLFCSVFHLSFSARLMPAQCGWISLVCCILVLHINFKMPIQFPILLRLSTLSVSFSDSFCVVAGLRFCAVCIYICPLKLHSFHHFHTFFSPFRYLFNLIWFHFLAVVVLFLLALSRIDRSGVGLNISIPVHSCFVPTTFFPSFDCNSFVSVLLNYLKLIKPRTWIDFRFASF